MLVVEWDAYDAVLTHAAEDEPVEACGVLAGVTDGDTVHVEVAIRLANEASSPRVEYRIDPAALLSVFDDVEAVGRSVVGFYHSHPVGPPSPSPRDEDTARWPGYYYAVVSRAGRWPTFDAWVWDEESFARDAVTVVGRVGD